MSMGLKTKEVVEVVSVSTSIKDKGVCVTCSHAPTCVFLKSSHRPTWYCEEFDEVAAAPVSLGEAAVPQLKASTNGNGNGNGVSAGLCYNCEIRTTCNYRKPGQAVFNCEEYQ